MASKKLQTQPEIVESPEKQFHTKRMIGVTSDKGGNGKSTVSRMIADLAIQKEIPTLAFDCDKRNAQLYRYYNQAFTSAFNSGAGAVSYTHLTLPTICSV